jgi:uncharacterized membrane protein YfcA
MTLLDALAGLALAMAVAAVTTPAGVSGAVFLLPVQTSLLQVASPAVTPTNLLYNVIATPGALLRFRSEGRLAGPLVRLLVTGTVPGVILGTVIRVELLAGTGAFRLLLSVLLVPLGAWLALGRAPRAGAAPAGTTGWLGQRRTVVLALTVGVVGGIYGIGGGSLLGPILVASGLSVAVVAPAALASTFVTSVVGVLAYGALAVSGRPAAAPVWTLGVVLGLGGLAGAYLGARLQPRVPERALRRTLGVLAMLVGLAYAVSVIASA